MRAYSIDSDIVRTMWMPNPPILRSSAESVVSGSGACVGSNASPLSTNSTTSLLPLRTIEAAARVACE